MRLYLDEDCASRELATRLAAAGHELIPTIRAATDREAWRIAQSERAALITMNAKDFIALAAATPQHAGLLLIRRDNDPRLDLRAVDITIAVNRVQEVYGPELAGITLSLNQFRRPAGLDGAQN